MTAVVPADQAVPTIGRVRLLDVLALVIVWLALILPNSLVDIGPRMLGLPVELVVLGLLALVVPPRAVRAVGMVLGVVLGLLTVIKVMDMGFLVAFNRLSRPPWDLGYLHSGMDLLTVAVGRSQALTFAAGAALLVVALLVVLPWATTRSLRLAGRHRGVTGRAVVGLGAAWLVLFGLAPSVATATTATMTAQHARLLMEVLDDERTFQQQAATDPLASVPQASLLRGLRGKDVLVVFVESYGRVAIQDSSMAAGVDAVLDGGTQRLKQQGWHSRSAFLSSPTFGGISWLAHSTLQSGLWVNSQQRYDRLLQMQRSTLSSTFARAGWRTVSDVPSNEQGWDQGRAFYGYDKIYDAHNVGYAGPRFGYSTMPDQYVLDVFGRKELGSPHRKPVMAEIDLSSSHTPWTPLPAMLPGWALGDGSVYSHVPPNGPDKDALWSDPAAVRAAYGQSVQYTLSSLIWFVQTYGDRDLVMVVLGDHQPATIVSGNGASHDVPVSIIARDPGVLAAVESWGWQPGLRPDPVAPVSRMDTFRDQFVSAFSR